MDDNKGAGERAESVISDILISDSCVENIIACIDSYEISSMENKLQYLSESDPRQESLVMDHDKEPVPHSSRCSVNSLNLSQDKTQPPSEPDQHHETQLLDIDLSKEPVLPSSRCSVNSLNLSQDKTQPPSIPDQHHENESLDMDQSKVLLSSKCPVNSLNISQDKTQPPSEPDQHHENESPDMDQNKETILPSSRCLVNSLNLSQGVMQPPSEPNTLDMDQSKEPVHPSSRCSVNFLNFSQGSTQSTLPPPASQQSSSGLLPSLRNNTYGTDIQAYGKSVTKQPKRQRRSNTISEASKMKQIKETHKHLYQVLKNSSVLTQSDKNLLANAKQMLFSIKLQHVVLCESLKADCMRKVPSNKCRESLKKRISLLQSRQHKLLLLFQEHNVITKKMKVLDYNWCKEAEIATKGQPMLSRKNLPSFSQDKTFTKNFELESESASTIYSVNCSQKKKPKIKKRMKVRDGSALRKSQQPISQLSISKSKTNQANQQPMSESVIRSDKMNLFCQQPMSESVIKSDNKMNLSCQQPMSESAIISDNKINQSSQQPMSKLAIISGNETNLSAQQPMSKSAMISKTKFPNCSKQTSSYSINIANRILKLDSKSSSFPSLQNKNAASDDDSASSSANMSANFTATPIGTITDFTQNIQSQHDFSNDRLILNSAVTSPSQQLQIPPATNQHLQNSLLGGNIFCTSRNSQRVSVDAVESFENYEKTKEVDKLQESTEEKTKSLTDKASFDKIYCEISTLTRINLIEDEELVPLDRILPSCQNMDIFANISFPKFLWKGFHKWP